MASDAITLIGRLQEIMETESFDSGFRKRSVILKTAGDFPQELKIDFFKEKIVVLNNFIEGEAVEICVNIRGNEYNGKHYVQLAGWLIHHDKSEAGKALPEATPEPESFVTEPTVEDQGQMPF